MKKNKLIEVEWIDSFSITNEWRHKKDINKKDRSLIKSVGYFFHKSKEHLIIFRGKGNGYRNGLFYIPLGCIKKIRRLK